MADIAQDAPPAATRLGEAIGRLRIASVRGRVNERTMLYVGGGLALLGLIVVVLGWYGAAHNVNLPEQIPYVISGGLLGLGLVFLGGFCYFAYWVTQLTHEQQRQTDALVTAIASLRDPEAPAAAGPVAAGAGRLVATAKGTMAHRPDCSVVAGKRGLRQVSERDDLKPCALCNPY
jgi:hypothetical protein